MLKNKRVIPGAETGQPTFQFVRCLLVDLAAETEVSLTRDIVNLLLGLLLAASWIGQTGAGVSS
jgi:hypothetical protein